MLGLILEGGASRTVYSCGILDALLEENIRADYVIGASAGAAFGVSYCSGQIGRNKTLACEYMGTKEYMGINHLLNPKNHSYYNLDYVYDAVPNKHLPFDYEAFKNYKGRFEAVVTNIETGKAEYMPVTGDDKSWNVLRASCALPLIFPEIEIDGQKYLDGGLSDSIPFERAIEQGCDKNIIILTRPRDYIKKPEKIQPIIRRAYRKHPNLIEDIVTRADKYNECVEKIHRLREQGKVFVFTPRSVFGVGRTEGDPKKLERLYDHGYNHAKWAMDDLKRYLEK